MRAQYRHRGIIFVTAIVALAVMLIVGTAFMSTASNQLRDAQRDLASVHAIAMADAGVHYMIWKQKYSGSPIPDAQVLAADINPRSLQPTDSWNKLPLVLSDSNADKAWVWLQWYKNEEGKTTGYQVISKGYFRGSLNSSVRGVLEGKRPLPDVIVIPPASQEMPTQLDYLIYSEAGLTIGTSTNVFGSIGSNGSVTLNTSGGGSLHGDVYAAGAIIIQKENGCQVTGTGHYGTKIADRSGKDVTSSGGNWFAKGVQGGAKTRLVPTINRDAYKAWADREGMLAQFEGGRLSDAGALSKKFLYCNYDSSPDYTLKIDTNLKGPMTLFVDGNIEIAGNTTLGAEDKPISLIATGSITLKGTCNIYGLVWTKGAFGNGTPTIKGSILCNNLASFQGNPQLIYKSYTNTVIVPPADDNGGSEEFDNKSWRVASWERI